MDNIDTKILNTLCSNSRLSFRQIAKKHGISTGTVMSRIRAMEKSGIIKKYSALLNYEKLGYDITVIIEMKILKGKLFEVENKISTHPNVKAVYDVTGDSDAVVVATFRNRREMDKFVKKIQTYDFVERTETKLVLNTMKEGHIIMA